MTSYNSDDYFSDEPEGPSNVEKAKADPANKPKKKCSQAKLDQLKRAREMRAQKRKAKIQPAIAPAPPAPPAPQEEFDPEPEVIHIKAKPRRMRRKKKIVIEQPDSEEDDEYEVEYKQRQRRPKPPKPEAGVEYSEDPLYWAQQQHQQGGYYREPEPVYLPPDNPIFYQ